METLTIRDGPTTVGDGPKNSAIRRMLDLVLDDISLFNKNENDIGYRDLNFSHGVFTDPSRQATLWAAGVVAALHIIRTSSGPHPMSPFLVYLSLEDDYSRLVSEDFIRQFDTETATAFFSILREVEGRKCRGETPYLYPLRYQYLEVHGSEVCMMCR
jgi:hypothetical protein